MYVSLHWAVLLMRILLIVIVFILEVKFLLIIWLISCVKICTSGQGDDFFVTEQVYLLSVTHTRLMALCPGLPGWAGTRKVKPIWILLKQETVSGSSISWAICKSVPRSRQITTPAPRRCIYCQWRTLEFTSMHNEQLFTITLYWAFVSYLLDCVFLSAHCTSTYAEYKYFCAETRFFSNYT